MPTPIVILATFHRTIFATILTDLLGANTRDTSISPKGERIYGLCDRQLHFTRPNPYRGLFSFPG